MTFKKEGNGEEEIFFLVGLACNKDRALQRDAASNGIAVSIKKKGYPFQDNLFLKKKFLLINQAVIPHFLGRNWPGIS